VIACAPDIIEWRVDFFEGIGVTDTVLAMAEELRSLAGPIPIIFTRRARHEGGEEIAVAEPAIVKTYAAVCASGSVDFIDYELSQAEESRQFLRHASTAHGVGMILSCHHFSATPGCEAMVAALTSAAAGGADVAKLAVMPQSTADVLELLRATQIAEARLSIPVVTMAMGGKGAITRIGGWVFGSALTFAAGAGHSAPGQMPIRDMRVAISMLARAAGAD
jgi:3-dehydroquinate dehydratase-1